LKLVKHNSNDPTTLSLRLAPDERRLIEEAAGKKGWKAANFLRVSALERAAQVLNLSRPTSFDFSGAARRFAEVLLAPRDVSLILHAGIGTLGRFGEGAFHDLDYADPDELRLEEVGLHDFRPARLTPDEVEKLAEAMRLGGVEFAAKLIVECRRLGTVANDPNLPPPIDPHNLKD
jgi:uncharacterized protein (DUF1778 family)